ncbi:hypothetical protein BC943DRAFT_85315 [Umbelopsis sp. AD052]|nr:hypothetical protein BC943DRAFT_85315 [Umbelopsis sp. AD052]
MAALSLGTWIGFGASSLTVCLKKKTKAFCLSRTQFQALKISLHQDYFHGSTLCLWRKSYVKMEMVGTDRAQRCLEGVGKKILSGCFGIRPVYPKCLETKSCQQLFLNHACMAMFHRLFSSVA